jgi:hypothetical protein
MSNIICLNMQSRTRDRAAEEMIARSQPDLIAQLREEFSNYPHAIGGYACAVAQQMLKQGVKADEIVRRARACARNMGSPAPRGAA